MTVRANRYQAMDVDTPEKVAGALLDVSRAQKELQSLQRTVQTHESLACGGAGQQIRINHGLGRKAKWAVVDWVRSGPGGYHALQKTSDDGKVLTLESWTSGTATLEVW